LPFTKPKVLKNSRIGDYLLQDSLVRCGRTLDEVWKLLASVEDPTSVTARLRWTVMSESFERKMHQLEGDKANLQLALTLVSAYAKFAHLV
jgi:hypothetical protein